MTDVVARDVVARPDVLIDTRFDQQIRWTPGERLDHLFEQQVDRLRAEGHADRLAVDADDGAWTYEELDCRANRLARYLAHHGVLAGDRVGLLFDHAVDGYLGMLATLKLNAAYVPLDAGFPPDRLAYICHDAGVRTVVTCRSLAPALSVVSANVLAVDADAAAVAAEPGGRLTPEEQGIPVDELAYVIYTSGSTGRPKGVAIEHGSICNFVRVAAEVYGATGEDRFYQGMTIAFDFSVEEIWVPWMVGATLVPKPYGGALVGEELRDFLLARHVTALCCVPTLLATLEGDVPQLRFLLVSGEACPQDLIARWHRRDRRFLNVYGPTEATVTATWCTLDPDRRVTIGVPLPTYSVVIVDPESNEAVARGEQGEVCIGGIALSTGYVNRPDLTAKAFVEDRIGLPNNPSGKLYRTGDLGRVDEDGNIEYLGRIDLQVKIRGYRIELTEIESVLLQHPGIATAVVEPYKPEPGIVELVAYYCRRGDTVAVDPVEVQQLLRDRLPGYMVPAYFTELDKMPMLPSDKVDRKKLPPPEPSRRLGGLAEYVAPEGPLEESLAQVLAEVMRLDRVGATAHFFDDLGSNSLLMARFCARVRERPGLGSPVMKDVYRHPTVRLLAGALADAASAAEASAVPMSLAEGPPPARRVSNAQYVAIAVAQTLTFAAVVSLSAFLSIFLFDWYTEATTWPDAYVRSVTYSAVMLAFLFALPVAAKWLLLGRATAQQIPVWGLAYYRFWVVRRLMTLSPARLTAGTPVYSWYLRTLGAHIGKNTIIHSNGIPAFPDLLWIGDNSVVLQGAVMNCYKAESGVIHSGPVTIGNRAFVGGSGVLDIDTELGDDAQLAHASSLVRGQRVPPGETWHGTPAVPTEDDYRTVPEITPRPLRGVLYGVWSMLGRVLFIGPVVLTVTWALIHTFPVVGGPLLGAERLPWDAWPLNVIALAASLALVPVGLITGQLVAFTVPRLFNLLLKPGRVYPLYGVRFVALRTVRRMTNSRLIPLFGDSNYITGFLSRLGYRLKPIEQTGTNFGMAVGHDVPYLVRIGTGTMVSDGLTLMNAEYSSTAFRVQPTIIGARNFFGNAVLVPPDAKIGENVLLGTKVLVPISGEMRHDVGLLGSPPFEIPRSVQRDAVFDHLKSGPEHERRLRAKLRYNTATIAWTLLSRWLFTVVTAMLTLWAFDLHHEYGHWPLALVLFTLPLLSAAYFLALEWASMRFRRLQPQYCSVYDPYFWRHERFWKLGSSVGAGLFNGTPFKGWILRAQGARVGRQLFDDGSSFVERSLVSVGDYCTLNAGSIAQSHSLEDGTFKSDRIVIGDGATLAPAAFVHYGARVGAGALIEVDSFLMKGEEVPPGQRWHGNPAMPARALAPAGPEGALVPASPAWVDAVAPRRAARPLWSDVPGTPRRALPPRRPITPTELLDDLRAGPPVVPVAGVAVHLFAVEACREHAGQLESLLGRSDRAAIAAMASAARATRFTAARAVVRLLLEGDLVERYPGDADQAWTVSSAPGGAPTLLGPDDPVQISISYSDELVAIALSEDYRIGVDVAAPTLAEEAVTAVELTDAERAALAGHDSEQRDWAFLSMWTLKEATAKCLGEGSARAFTELDTLAPTAGQEAHAADAGPRCHQEVWDHGERPHWLAVAWQPLRG